MEYWQALSKVEYSDEKANKVVLSSTTHSRTTLWCLKPGQGIKPHAHAGDHIWVVLEGSGLYHGTEGTADVSVMVGTTLVAPAGEVHGVTNTGSTGLVFLSISAGE